MSKNIIIQEGGAGKQMTAAKLQTNLVGGGTCNWVPEDEIQQNKYIEANGEYHASADGVHGYSNVVVCVPGGAGGQGPGGTGDNPPGGPGSRIMGIDEDGDDAVVGVDNDGYLTPIEKILSSIKVIEPPTNPNYKYYDGQVIGTGSMRVDGYLKSGSRWQTIPNDQIILEPSVAAYDAKTDPQEGWEYEGIFAAGKFHGELWSSKDIVLTEDGYGGGLWAYVGVDTLTGPRLSLIFATDSRSQKAVIRNRLKHIHPDGTETIIQDLEVRSSCDRVYTKSNKTVYFWQSQNMSEKYYVDILLNRNPPSGSVMSALWGMIYDTPTPVPSGSRQTITAKWTQPQTGKILTDTFEILVAPPDNSGNN